MNNNCNYGLGCVDIWCHNVQQLIVGIWKNMGHPQFELYRYKSKQASSEKGDNYTGGYKDLTIRGKKTR